MISSTACPDPSALRQLSLGQISGRHADRIRGHVQSCAACQQRLRVLVEGETQGDPGNRARRETPGKAPEEIYQALKQEDALTFLSPPQGPGEIGRMSHYRVLRKLGEGGMGFVFQAEDINLERTVALKVMKPQLAANPLHKQRFDREARATAKLKNDHIVTIYQVGEEKGIPFLAMEFLQGIPLDLYLAKGSKPSILQILRLARGIALGLAAAHEKNLIHRDIKPANIWIEATGGGRVKILDFGLARPAEDDIHITRSGTILGTPAYMSPEQARGQKLDPRSDLFSLGCVLYRLTTGQIPFQGETTMAVLTSLAMDDPRPVRAWNPDVPEPLANLTHQLLQKNPQDRPPSAKAVAQTLAAMEKDFAGGVTAAFALPGGVGTRPPGMPPAPGDVTTALAPPKRRRWLRWVGIAAALVVGLGILSAIINPKGTLKVQLDDDSIELTIRMGERAYFDRSKERQFELPTGAGKIDVYDAAAGFLFFEDFEIVRNERTSVDLNREVNARRAEKKGGPETKKRTPLEALDPAGLPADLRTLASRPGKGPPPELVTAWRVPPSAAGKKPTIKSLVFSPEGDWLITSGKGVDALLWKIGDKGPPQTVSKSAEVAGVWLPGDGKKLYIAFPNVLHILALKDRGLVTEIKADALFGGGVWGVSPDGNWVANGDTTGSLTVFDAGSGKPFKRARGFGGLRALVFHPKASTLLVQTWQADQPRFLTFVEFPMDKGWEGPDRRDFKISSAPGWGPPQFSPDGALVFFSVPDNTLLLRYDVANDKVVAPLGPVGLNSAFAFSPRGDRLVTVSDAIGLRVWDTLSGKVQRTLDLPFLPSGGFAQPSFAPDGRHVAVAYQDLVFIYRVE